MKKLAVCIPNYNRIKELKRLTECLADQIRKDGLYDRVQICISDDCSPQNPTEIVDKIIKQYTDVDIVYRRKPANQGMDHNFLDSALLANSEYVWIVGNDDIPEDGALVKIVEFVEMNRDADLLVTPFDVFDEEENYRTTIYPLDMNETRRFDTASENEIQTLILSMNHNSAIFGFLSNVVFRRDAWEKNKDRFSDKMQSIFIQMYLNIYSLINGAVYYYWSEKIIKNIADDKTNNSIDRICKVLFGLDGVVEYFFEGEQKKHLKKILTDAYINADIWNLPDNSEYKVRILNTESIKNDIYRQYLIPKTEIKTILGGKKVIVYGTGDYGKRTWDILQDNCIEILGFADSSKEKQGKKFFDKVIMSIDEMLEATHTNDVFVIVANHFYLCEMVNTLEKNGVKKIGVVV